MTRISLTENYDDRSVVSKIQKLDGKVDASVIDVTDVKQEVADKLDELGGEFATQKVALQNDIDSGINQAKAEARTTIARLGAELEGALDGVDERIERRVVSAEENISTAIARLDAGLARVDDATDKAIVAKVMAEQATQRLADELMQLHSVFHYRGTVNNANVPYLDLREGDVWNIGDDGYYPKGSNIVCDGQHWDKLSETVDLSGYVTRTTYEEQVYPVINAVPQIRETASTAYSYGQQAYDAATSAGNAATRAENLAKQVQSDTAYAVSRVPSLNNQVIEHIQDIEALQNKDTELDGDISALDTRVSALEAGGGGGGGSGGAGIASIVVSGNSTIIGDAPAGATKGTMLAVIWQGTNPSAPRIRTDGSSKRIVSPTGSTSVAAGLYTDMAGYTVSSSRPFTQIFVYDGDTYWYPLGADGGASNAMKAPTVYSGLYIRSGYFKLWTDADHTQGETTLADVCYNFAQAHERTTGSLSETYYFEFKGSLQRIEYTEIKGKFSLYLNAERSPIGGSMDLSGSLNGITIYEGGAVVTQGGSYLDIVCIVFAQDSLVPHDSYAYDDGPYEVKYTIKEIQL